MNTNTETRSRSWLQLLMVGVVALAGCWLAGCRTAAYKQGNQAADNAQAAAVAIQTESQALTGTMSTLNDLADKPGTDLKPQFQSFSAALDSLIAARKRGEVAVDRLLRHNAGYFATWDKQLTTITNTDVRSRSEARKAEVSKQFDAARNRCLQAQETLRSATGYLEDIRRALSIDLTQNGVQAVKNLISNANSTATAVQADLKQAGTELNALSAQMSSGKVPAAP